MPSIFRRALPLLPAVALALVLSSCSGAPDEPVQPTTSTVPSDSAPTQPQGTETTSEDSAEPSVLPGTIEGVPVVPRAEQTAPTGNSGVNLPNQQGAGDQADELDVNGAPMSEARAATAQYVSSILVTAFRQGNQENTKEIRLKIAELRKLVDASDLGNAWKVEAQGQNIIFSRTNSEYKNQCSVEIPSTVVVTDNQSKISDFLTKYVSARATCTQL